MITKKEHGAACARALEYYKKAGIMLTPKEKRQIKVVHLNLNDLAHIGLEVVVYMNTRRCSAKELVLFPWQTCPEHRHPSVNGQSGKEETFRCRWGIVYLYVPGKKSPKIHARLPKGNEKYYTVWHQIILRAGEQYTLLPNKPHWFQGGPKGAVLSEFSTASLDEFDTFTDPRISRWIAA